jgi:uncharacterized protein
MSDNGRFCWYELMAPDAKAAEAFYGAVVGWTFQDASQPDKPYSTFSVAEGPVGGILTTPSEALAAGAGPAWFGYINVDDVDAYAEKVKAAGGAIHRPPADIPGVGRFAMAADPGGAVFVLFKPNPVGATPPAPARSGKPGHVGWRELMAADGPAAFEFYSGLFGWTKAEAHDMGPMGVYQLFAVDGETVGGMMTRPPFVPHPRWQYYFQVDAIGAAIKRLEASGGKVINGPHRVPTGEWMVQGIDPQSATFALLSETP